MENTTDKVLKSYECEVVSIDQHHDHLMVKLKTKDNFVFSLPYVVFNDRIVVAKKQFIYYVMERENKTRYHYIEDNLKYKEHNEKLELKQLNIFQKIVRWIMR